MHITRRAIAIGTASCLLCMAFSGCDDDEGTSTPDGAVDGGGTASTGGTGGAPVGGAGGTNPVGDGGVPGDAGLLADGGVGSPFARPGTRLFPTGYRVGDQLQLINIYDRELESTCRFRITSAPDAAAETMHCVPGKFAEMLFTDAACTQEVLRVRNGRGSACESAVKVGAIVTAGTASTCGANTTVVRALGEEVTPTKVYWRFPRTGVCTELPVESHPIFASKPAPLEKLVSGVVSVVPTAEPGLQVEMITGGDGSQFRGDTRLDNGDHCQGQPLDGRNVEERCLPDRGIAQFEDLWSDAGCSSPAFKLGYNPSCPKPSPRHGQVYEYVEGCARPKQVYTLGAEITTVYGMGAMCQQATTSPATLYYAAGASKAAADYPTLKYAYPGEQRLRLQHYAAGNGQILFPGSDWWDMNYGERCIVRDVPGGEVRCVQNDFLDASHFADGACTQQAYTKFVGGCNRAVDRPVIRTEDAPEGQCKSVISKIVLLKRHTGPVFVKEGDACVASTIEEGRAAYVDDKVLAASDFPALTRVTAP